MARVHIVIAAHLAMSPRAQREASILQQVGYDVTINGVWLDSRLAEIDRELMRRHQLRFSPSLDLRDQTRSSRGILHRLASRWAREQFRFASRFSPELLGYGVRNQLAACRAAMADLTIVHGESGLWIAQELLKDGCRVGIDFEDWFSRDLQVVDRKTRPVRTLAQLESLLLNRGSYRLASSQVMAEELARVYKTVPPTVVRNAGQEQVNTALAPSTPDTPLRLLWFSQTIGPGRGLELLFSALSQLRHPARLTLRGNRRYHGPWLDRQLSKVSHADVHVLPSLPPWDLPASIADHEIGLALETPEIPSRDLCISNKLFHYLASGLAVIATPTQGHREAFTPCQRAGTILRDTSPSTLAETIDAYAANRAGLLAARRAAKEAAAGIWNGEADRETILAEAQHALANAGAL